MTAQALGADAARVETRDAAATNPYRGTDPVLARFWRRGHDAALAQRITDTAARDQ